MKPFILIAVAGAAGAGKDTAATILRDNFGFSTYAFASPIKAALCAMFGWDPALMDNRVWKETTIPDIGKSPREMMQTLGTEWGRELVNQRLWLLLARRNIEAAKAAGLPGLVLTDCRFKNEAEFVHEHGGKVIELRRRRLDAVAAHVSERPLDPHLVDLRINNDGSIADLGEHMAIALARIDGGAC
jgi:hypothetical protein